MAPNRGRSSIELARTSASATQHSSRSYSAVAPNTGRNFNRMSIPCTDTFAILGQMGERLQRRLEEGASFSIGRQFDRFVAGLTQITHCFIPERCVQGMVRKAFDHILRVLLILRFHGAQYARVEHLTLRRDQATICDLVNQGMPELQLEGCRIWRFVEELRSFEFRQQ